MKSYEKIKDMLCEEVEKIGKEGRITASNLETVHKLTDTIKNIDKIMMLEEGGEYSEEGGMWRADGSYRDGGSSYARGRGRYARRDSMGRYSSDDGYSSDGNYSGGSYARDGRGYSRDDGKDKIMEHIEEAMDGADPKSREILRRAIKQLESA